MNTISNRIAVVVLIGCAALIGPLLNGASARAPGTTSDTYLYHVEYDTGRFPQLLDVQDSVALLSWVRFGQPEGGIAGSLVLRKDSIDSIQRHFRDQPLHAVQHEYVVPHPEGWWSLHVSSYRQDPATDHPPPTAFPRLPLSFQRAKTGRTHDTTWRYLRESFGPCGRSLGNYFHVSLHCGGDDPGTRHDYSMSYAFFQRTSRRTVVIGDLVTRVEKLGPVIRYLYRHDMKMLSLAYNSVSENRRLYFIHFAGAGRERPLASRIRRLETIARSPN